MSILTVTRTLRQLSTLLLLLPLSCKDGPAAPSQASIRALQLKEGKLISCGPPDKEFGAVSFAISSTSSEEAASFNQAMALLHSFEYDEAEKLFAGIIARDPACAMAYWGVAMSNFHPLWAPPTVPELKKGALALSLAATIGTKTDRELGYIHALQAFYNGWEKASHAERCLRFEQAMEELHVAHPDDVEATVLYALSLDAAADPKDKTRTKQRKAGAMLTALYPSMPNHPGIIHYIIHTYDYPEVAELALPAAKRYAEVAPSSAHALHMPSHIFTRLGLWDDCIKINLLSVSAGECYAQAAGIHGHWDEELHGMDYLVYAYLQKGQDELAEKQLNSLSAMDAVSPVNFKVAYAFAAIPARFVLEQKIWPAAAELELENRVLSWKDYPWQEAILHFARGLGLAHLGRIDPASIELAVLGRIHERLIAEKDGYKAGQVMIQMKALEAWITLEKSRMQEGAAILLARQAADLEDATEKHPVTPCEVIPARELLADLLMETDRPAEALKEYEADLKTHPGRYNGLFGAGLAALKSGDKPRARTYFKQLVGMVDTVTCNRTTLLVARTFLQGG